MNSEIVSVDENSRGEVLITCDTFLKAISLILSNLHFKLFYEYLNLM